MSENFSPESNDAKPVWERVLEELSAMRGEIQQMDVRLARIENITSLTLSDMRTLRADFKEHQRTTHQIRRIKPMREP